ncbi:Inner membrane transport protein YdhC [Rhizobiaceae bacterium]|nr:Inner membrane transport protein YdhC [Rhizobiaceae bacterium]
MIRRPHPAGAPAAGLPAAALRERGLTILVGLFLMLQPLATDFYLASLPGLSVRFDVPPSTVQLTLSFFVAGFGAMQLVSGPMSDRWGRRPVLLAGLALYVVASLACAASPGIGVLIAARFAQAVGCCTVVVIARAIVRDAFEPAAGARVLARASSLLAIGPMAGPIVGSLLEVRYGFRAAFLMIAALGAVLLAVAARRLPETLAQPDPRALEPRRLAAGYAALLRSPVFVAYTIVGAAMYGGLFAFISGSSFVLIRVLGVPTAWFGACFAFVVTGFLVGTFVCRRLLPRRGLSRTLRVGATLAAIAGIACAALAAAGVRHYAALLVPAFGFLLAHGIVFPCAQSGATAAFPDRAGAAAGLFGALIMGVAVAVGSWIGMSHDGTPLPLSMTLAGAGIVALAGAWRGVMRHPGHP